MQCLGPFWLGYKTCRWSFDEIDCFFPLSGFWILAVLWSIMSHSTAGLFGVYYYRTAHTQTPCGQSFCFPAFLGLDLNISTSSMFLYTRNDRRVGRMVVRFVCFYHSGFISLARRFFQESLACWSSY